MRRKIPYLHILCHSLSKNSHGKLLCDMEQLQRAALHDVAIGLPQKCRTIGWLRRCHAALPRSGFVQSKLCRRRHNLYSITTNQAAIAALFRVLNRYVGNLPHMPGVFPDYPAPVVRNAGSDRDLIMMRWGMPSPPRVGGPSVTNIRNTSSPH